MYEYWVVIESETGKVIAHCAEEQDAIMMLLLDKKHSRSYRKQKFIMDQVIDISCITDKQLPGQIGLPFGKVEALNSHKEKLPEGQGQPVIV